MSESATPYLIAITVAVASTGPLNYLTNGQAIMWGQNLGVLIPLAGALLAGLLWLPLKGRKPLLGLGSYFLYAVLGLWFLHALLTRLHGDLVPYSIWLTPVAVLLLLLKPPSASETVTAFRVLGWVLVIGLLITQLLEILGLIAVFALPDEVVEFEVRSYWLPLSGFLGIEGRWPGPYRHPNEIGVLAAFLVVFGGIVRGKSGWLFAAAGVWFLLAASTRVGFVSAAAGVAVLATFGSSFAARRISMRVRLVGSMVVVVVVTLLMWSQSMNLTGRTTNIWPAFLDLWKSSPWVGVGSSGMNSAGGLSAQYMNGHNVVIDELSRNGLVGLVMMTIVLCLAILVSIRPLLAGTPGPMAIVATFLVVGISHTPVNWLALSPILIALVLSGVLAAGQNPVNVDSWRRQVNKITIKETDD